MRILMVASEVTPLAKVGGLGDVIGALPKALVAFGVDVRVVTGYYGTHDESKFPTRVVGKISVPWGKGTHTATVRSTALPGSSVPVYLIGEPELVSSGGVYDSSTAMASGQPELVRFLFISKAATLLPTLLSWQPDVWHLHDWHAAAVTLFLPREHAPTLLTIHNLANQGWATPETLSTAGLPAVDTPHLNLFRAGLERATFISTVSPTYAVEIQTAPEGEGLEDLLSSRQHELIGITNGIDTEVWNPNTDPQLTVNYNSNNLTGKAEDRRALRSELGLAEEDVPLFGLVSRLTDQKGIELIPRALKRHLTAGELQFVFLGVGDQVLEQSLLSLTRRHPRLVAGKVGFDAVLAQRIYAASDFFLMPSRFEPCGLGQLIAMRYGAVPVVRATGGLKDTVVDAAQPHGTGVVFTEYSAAAFGVAVERALALWHNHATMEAVVYRGMERDSSWAAAAQTYRDLYLRLCQPN